ncbi:MAG TPA: aminoglycoside phosphotransferase family protein [Candidatus Paceibacterota bacterium]|nr:aminoglycoside phosphotransferase family protein [Candidatus Paceibacterota bacterium]
MSLERLSMSSRISFQNEPKLSEHEVDKTFNEKRVALAGQLESFLVSHSRFQDKEVSVTFAHKGVSSLIAIIETLDEKLVLKIPLSRTYVAGEAQFLRVWEQAGVKVPHVIEDGVLDDHPFVLMEYIDAPTLTNAYTQEEMTAKGIYTEMGRTLRLMHTPEAEGYGRVVGGKAEFTKFSDWLYSPDIEERIAYVKEHNLLDEEQTSIQKAFEILQEHISENPKSSYCHDDFGAANIFATTPITVFDPNPRFHNGYLDLGRSMVSRLSHGVSPAPLIEGYFEGAPYNQRALHAAVMLNTYMKFPYWHKVKRTEQIQRMQEYFGKSGIVN